MGYYQNRQRARTQNNEPTMTDQSQAKDTDINVIVNQFMKTGQAPGAATQPMYGDFTQLPNDLRGMIELNRSMKDKRASLPPQLKDLALEELLALTPEALEAKLKPAEQPKEEPK